MNPAKIFATFVALIVFIIGLLFTISALLSDFQEAFQPLVATEAGARNAALMGCAFIAGLPALGCGFWVYDRLK